MSSIRPATSADDGSEIAAVEAHVYSAPLSRPVGFAQGWVERREAAVARVVTAGGTAGWGEAYAPARPAAAAIATVAPHYLGCSVFERVAVGRSAYHRLRDYGRSGVLCAALSAVATACCDAAARALGVPAWALLGGRARPALRPYASGLFFAPGDDPTAHYAETTRALLDAGFDGVKLKIGLGVEADARAVERVLGVAGAGTAVMADANHAYDWVAAVALERRLAQYPLAWLEEPLSPEHPGAYARLRERATLPLAGGESLGTRHDGRAWLSAGACDILQPDLSLAGGLDEAVAIGAMAEAWEVRVAPHCFGLGIGLAASLHWAAVLASDGMGAEPVWIEVDTLENPIRDALLADSAWFGAHGATLALPQGPGLGVDPERIAAFRVV